ncbi:MAG: fluoride efflux transporter FluC [Brachybacterium tyrofermentans]|uniref:Fluoride-specific ion channel FluC n=1 Tax=Brachybacterium tyrofermentans TaxID=47848 RepID=A0ABW0FE49_9MICO
MTPSPPPPSIPRREDPRMHTVEMAALRFDDVDQTTDTFGSGPVQVPLPSWKIALLVAAGGAAGAMLRFAVVLIVPTVSTPTLVELPWATLWVNLLGCLGLGTLTGVLEARPGRPWVQPLLGVGLCGGFTTMSTVVLEGSAMVGADFPLEAFGYALLTVVLCLLATVAGLLGGRRAALALDARRPSEGSAGSAGSEESTDPDDLIVVEDMDTYDELEARPDHSDHSDHSARSARSDRSDHADHRDHGGRGDRDAGDTGEEP